MSCPFHCVWWAQAFWRRVGSARLGGNTWNLNIYLCLSVASYHLSFSSLGLQQPPQFTKHLLCALHCKSIISLTSSKNPMRWVVFSSVQFSHWVLSDSLGPLGLQHTRIPCLSPAPGAYSDSCPSSWWCRPIISSSVVPFSSCLQSFPASGSFQMSQFFPSGGQSIGVSALVSVLPMNIQDWFPLGWTGWSLRSPRYSQESSPTPQFKSINSKKKKSIKSSVGGLTIPILQMRKLRFREVSVIPKVT